MEKIINTLKSYFVGHNQKNEEYERAVWEHEQIGYKLYSIEVAIDELKRGA